MSRSTTLIVITFVALVLLFSAYLFLAPQPSVTYRTSSLTPTSRRSATGPTGSLGTGQGAWVKQFDDRTGLLSSQFRGEQYDRQPDNTVRVTKPEAQFYLSDGQILHLEGDTGVVTIPDTLRPGKDTQTIAGPSKPPTRGDLKSVRIQLFKDANSTTPTLTCVMDNATFDNETFRIFTRDAVIDGQPTPADQIPVTLTGTDYDFNGRGLTIRLNQRDRRLDYMEVTHGNYLTVKNPSRLTESLPTTQPAILTPSPGAQSAIPSHFAPPLPFLFATTDAIPPIPRRAATAAAKKPAVPAVTRPSGPAIYRALFQDNVRVTQSNQDLATGDQLQIDFLLDDNNSPTTRKSPATTAAGGSTPTPSAPPPLSPSPGTPGEGRGEGPPSSLILPPSSVSSPSSRPTQPPVTIHWTGKLTLSPTPAALAPTDLPTAKNSIVRIAGSPLNVRQGPSTITGTTLVYRTATQHLSLRGTDQFPLTLQDGKGAVVHGTSIDYRQQDRLATLDGPGSATKLLPNDDPNTPSTQPAKTMTTNWSRSATLYFTGQPNEPLRIETAKLAGNVSVQHPQLNLTASTLNLDFDPTPITRPSARGTASEPVSSPPTSPSPHHPTSSPTPDFTASDLRHLDATGAVHATVIGSNNRPQSISAEHLSLDTASTPDGRIYPKSLAADGNVIAQDPDQQLTANHLKTSLLPTTQPAPSSKLATANREPGTSVPTELEHLTATDNVSIKTTDGLTVSATRLDVDVDPATHAQHVRLLGSPAHVTSKENAVTGPYIEILPATETYNVRGPGQMHLLQRETPTSKPRPVDVSWKDSVTVDGKRNLIDVLGSVTVVSTDDTGAQNTATGNHLTITLVNNPATQPSTKTATTRKSPLTGIASSGDPMQNKTVQTITFEKGATLESVQTDKKTNDLLRQMNLIADVVTYDLPHKHVIVPVPGQLLFVNRAPAPAAKAPDPNNLGGSRGTTAFSWAHNMDFDQSANLMVMTGDVVIAHESDANDKPFRLDADKVTATLAPKATTQQATPNTPQATPDSVDLKHVTAEGAIRFTSKDTQLTASTVDFDPATGILIARGQGRDPVHLFDPDGVQIGTASEVTYNTKTGQSLKMTNVQARTRRRQ